MPDYFRQASFGGKEAGSELNLEKGVWGHAVCTERKNVAYRLERINKLQLEKDQQLVHDVRICP